MNFERLRYELRLMGRRVILTPVLVMAGFGVFAVLLHYLHVTPARFLAGGLEMILPLMAGVVVATITSQDPAIELQLTVPRKYHITAMGRLALIAAWAGCVALLSAIIITTLNLGYIPQTSRPLPASVQFLIGQLTWIAPLLWFAATGLCLAILTRSRAASATLLSGVWIVETLLKDYFAGTSWLRPVFLFPTTLLGLGAGPVAPTVYDAWLINRYEVIGMALILLPLGWLLLRNPEGLLKGSGEE